MASRNLKPARKLDKKFSATPLTKRLGPIPKEDEPNTIDLIISEGEAEVSVNQWIAMDTFNEGLRQALISWVNTTKEGRVVTDLAGSTRTKKMDFQFYGNPSKDIVGDGDIGKYSLVFKYTKLIVQPQSTNSQPTNITR